MSEQRKRQRTESLIKLLNQQKESKLRYEEANSHIKNGNLEKAIFSYNKALELNPTEKNALVSRSKCYILLGQPKKALQDAELALEIDKNFLKAIYQKAEALYYLGDFELSLMYYHRGLHVRPDHEGFKLGVHKAQKAIENAIGSSLGFPKKSNSSKASARSGTSERVNANASGRGSANTGYGSNKPKAHRKTKILGELQEDMEYLDSLIKNPNLKCKFKQYDTKLENCIKETVDYLNDRQEFWRQQMPPKF